MARFFAKTLLLLFLAAALGAGWALYRSPDPFYTVAEWISWGRYQKYDAEILDVARKHGVDPLLVKAIVWRESEFHPHKVGTSGERGLMQVGEMAAADWVRANKVQTFVPTDLFAPRTNLEIGVWYLKQALQHWAGKADPVPFALAEYNAGKSRVDRWLESTRPDSATSTADFLAAIDFPKTRRYVETITQRWNIYTAERKAASGARDK